MKGRESGMPEEGQWENFFDAGAVVDKLVCAYAAPGDVVEFGSGYGTFTIPAAQKITGWLHAFDIEPHMVELVRHKADALAVENLKLYLRDFMEDGTGMPVGKVGHAMLYNILHVESPDVLLEEAFRVLAPGATLSVMHWRSDIPKPRGPALAIRPTPEHCRRWGGDAGFSCIAEVDLSGCAQYHFGLVFQKNARL